MLVGLRKKSANFLVKLMVLFLALTFALWGVGDMVSGSGMSTLATVGGERITNREFQRQAERYLGRVDRDVLKNPIFSFQILQGMISQKLLELEARRQGIIAGQDQAFDAMLNDAAFQNKEGAFSKEVFLRVIASNGFTEARYVDNLKKSLGTQMLAEPFYQQNSGPKMLAELLYKARQQERSADLVIVPPHAVKLDLAAGDEAAQSFYKDNIARYTTPELRTITYGVIHPDSLADKAEDALEKHINAIEDELAGGSTLAETAKKFTFSTTTLEPVSREGNTASGEPLASLPAYDNFLDVAFKAQEKVESPVIRSKTGALFIVRVEKITPEAPKPFTSVKADVIKDWTQHQQQTALAKYATEVSAQLAKGEAPQAINPSLRVVDSGRLTKRNVRAKGGYFADKDVPPAFGRELFSLEQGKSGSAHPLADGSYAIPILKQIHPLPNIDFSSTDLALEVEALRGEIGARYREDLNNAYQRYLETHHKVTVNDAALKQLTE